MGIEALLLPGGVVFAVVLFWISLYKGFFSHSTSAKSAQRSAEMPQVTEAPIVVRTAAEPVQETPPPTPTIVTSAVMSAPIAEAPPPFEEPQPSFTSPSATSTAIPTDTTAVTNIASPIENISSALVIAKPKRVRRTVKRLPTEGAPKRKRAVRAKPEIVAPESLAVSAQPVSGQQNEVNQ